MNESASYVHRDLLNKAPADLSCHINSVPRGLQQVQYAMKTEKAKRRLSHDEYYNLVELQRAIHPFIYKQELSYDDMKIFGYEPLLLEKLKMIMMSPQLGHIGLCYDTKFDLGDYYVSMLVFPELEFDQAPIIPLAYLIHEKRTNEDHDYFWQKLLEEIILICRILFSFLMICLSILFKMPET